MLAGEERRVRTVHVFVVLLAMLVAALPAFAGETVVYSEGFEDDNGGFTPGLGVAEWEWGTPAGSVGPPSAHSGTKCWATDLDNTLDRVATDGSIISPPIALPAISGNQVIRARLWAWIAIDGMYDRGEFFISNDGTNWQSLCEFFQSMDPSAATSPGWRKYEFTIPDSYAGGNVYLRFRAYVPYTNTNFYCGGGNDLAGVYVDDLAITVYDVTGTDKVFRMEAWEDPTAYASCPWVAPWNGEAFAVDNDIYSVARGPQNEFVDHYKLLQPLVADGAVYPLEIQEREQEDSFTDHVALIQVDHAGGTAIAPDQDGVLSAYVPAALVAPVTAVDGDGTDVLALVASADDDGYAAYHAATVELDFGDLDVSAGATLVLRAAGFVMGTGTPDPYTGPPAVVVETIDAGGAWVERGRLNPRFAYSEAAFDLAPYLTNDAPRRVRLRAISHDVKYHVIDRAALFVGAPPPFTATWTEPTRASFGDRDILPEVLGSDDVYFEMSTGEKFSVEFPVAPLDPGLTREFVFVSEGFYVPKSGTYLLYTWNGSAWVQRDGYSYPGSDAVREFDLSLFLPDPTGQYRVRIWQDYQYEPAGIDHVAMSIGGATAPLISAWDYRSNADCTAQVQASDNFRTYWSYCPRNRIVDVAFEGPDNIPPTVDPVSVTDTSIPTPTIGWTYADADGDPQAEYEVEVWTGADATGIIRWDPPVGTGTAASVVYAGSALTPGVTYYARVRASDGADWGPWAETPFVLDEEVENTPPTTDPVDVSDTGSPTPTIGWTYGDADGDPQVEYEVEVWTGAGGTGTPMWNPPVASGTGEAVVYGGSALTPGVTYYARVRAYDGTDWGPWSEAPFVYEEDLLVVLDSLTAEIVRHEGVLVRWVTLSEFENVGFRVLRAAEGAEPVIVSPFIPAEGSELNGAEYAYMDASDLGRGVFQYYLEDVDVRGTVTRHGPVTVVSDRPGWLKTPRGRIERALDRRANRAAPSR